MPHSRTLVPKMNQITKCDWFCLMPIFHTCVIKEHPAVFHTSHVIVQSSQAVGVYSFNF